MLPAKIVHKTFEIFGYGFFFVSIPAAIEGVSFSRKI